MHVIAMQDNGSQPKRNCVKHGLRFFLMNPAIRCRKIQNSKGWLSETAGQSSRFDYAIIGVLIVPEWNQYQVSRLDRGWCFTVSSGRRVNENEVTTGGLGAPQFLAQIVFRRKANQWERLLLLTAPPLSPTCRVLLRVHVQHEDIHARENCGRGDTAGQRGFALAAFIDRYCNRAHVQPFSFASVHISRVASAVKPVD